MAIISAFPGKSKPKLQEQTVNPTTWRQTVTPSSDYDGLSKVTVNAMTTVSKAQPDISVSSSGLITAEVYQQSGYISNSGTTSSTKQLPTTGATTITPSSSQQTAVSAGRYTTGNVIVSGDSNLIADNIKEGKSIFGVSGNLKVPFVGTANATANTISGEDVLTIVLTDISSSGTIPSADYKIRMMYIWGPDVSRSAQITDMYYDADNSNNLEIKFLEDGRITDGTLSARDGEFTLSRDSLSIYTLKIDRDTYTLRSNYGYNVFAVCTTDVGSIEGGIVEGEITD